MSYQIDVLREKWTESRTKEEKQHIECVASDAEKNAKFGSIERGGNGWCYTCLINPARKERYNCKDCAKKEAVDKLRRPIKANWDVRK